MNEMNQEQFIEEEGMTLQELFNIVWLNKLLIVFIVAWVTIFGVLYTYLVVEPEYTAETSIMVQVDIEATGVSEQTAISIAQNLISTYKEFVVANLVLEKVIEDVDGLPSNISPKALENMISISSQANVLIIYISVENTNPELAAQIANTLVADSIEILNEEDSYILLQNKLKLIDIAEVPTEASSPNVVLNIVISILLGGMISLGYIFVKELFNNKYQSTSEMEKHLNIKIIAAVPGTIKERKMVE